MFGYIKPYVPTLTVAQHEAYKAIYCGLCREMGKVTGQTSRAFLSFDFTYLAVFRMALNKDPVKFDRKACAVHPFRKRLFAKENDSLAFCARAAAILNNEKINDDLSDEKGSKKLKAKLISPVTKHTSGKCGREYDSLKKSITDDLEKLALTEKEKEASLDKPADCFADLLSEVASFGLEGNDRLIAQGVGRSVGKIIYVLDAADDVFDDIKCEKYNPIALVYGKDIFEKTKGKKDKKPLISKEIADELYTAVCLESSRLCHSLDLADLNSSNILAGIIYNISDAGIKAVARHVLYGIGENEDPFRHRY